MNAQTVVVDSGPRIEGHLRIDAEFDGSVITQAISTGTRLRGIEILLRDRDPCEASAVAERIGGECALMHRIASVRAVENALHRPISLNVQLIRNLVMVAQFAHDHVVHFYQRQALDWVNVIAALKADPKSTSQFARSISGYARSSPDYFAEIRQRLRTCVGSGQLGPFAGGYCQHSGYRLPPAVDLLVMAHYLEALAWQRRINQLQTLFGDVPVTSTAVNAAGLRQLAEIIALMREFVAQVYVPDLLAIGGFYQDWFAKGYGEGTGNFLTYGEFPNGATLDPATFLVPRGAILNRDLTTIHAVDLGRIQSPRWKGHAMETGPLARVLMMYASGHAGIVALVDQSLVKLGLRFDALYSVMGRNLARALECQILTDALPAWAAQLQVNLEGGEARTVDETRWQRSTWPDHAEGVGCVEAPRGALAHGIVIDAGLISNYRAVVPTTWNAGAYEAALEGIHISNPKQPLEILRTVRSFEPGLTCAVHLLDPDGAERVALRVPPHLRRAPEAV